MIQIYAPTISHEDEEVEELYEEISREMEKITNRYRVVMGDFDAKIGKYQQSDCNTT